jgi:hypothetical protein
MVLANMQLKKEEKDKFKKLTTHGGIIDLADIGKNTKSTLTNAGEGTTTESIITESTTTVFGQPQTATE